MGSQKVKTIIAVCITVIILLLLSSLWFSIYTIRGLKKNLALQVHTRTVIVTLKDNLTAMLNAETGERGFAITGDSIYLRPYNASLQEVHNTYNQARFLTQDNISQQKSLDTLDIYIHLKLGYIENVIALKKSGNQEAIKKLLIAGSGKVYMDNIRSIIGAMIAREGKLFVGRENATTNSIGKAWTIFILEAGFSLIVTFLLAVFIFSELNRRTRNERRIENYNTELVRKNKEIEQFAYIASHDLQEPLRTISNFSMLLDEKIKTNPDEQLVQYVGYIKSGAHRMSGLISDLLEYSRIGKDVTKTEINCNQLVAEIITDFSVAIKEKNATINVGPLPVVKGYIYLRSLFQNLISNALKFTLPGAKPLITISCIELRREYHFAVRDNGIGIEEKYFERIFTIFQRLHTRKEYPGTGIGLAQCRKIVEMHGGKIWVNSTPGEGTIFKFTIPKS